MVPGMKSGAGAVGQTQNTGGALGDTTTNLMIHGSQHVDMRITQNGLPTGTLQAGGGFEHVHREHDGRLRSDDGHRRRERRAADRRAAHQLHPEGRRQRVPRHHLLELRE